LLRPRFEVDATGSVIDPTVVLAVLSTPDFPLEGVALSMTAALPANATCFDTGEAGGT